MKPQTKWNIESLEKNLGKVFKRNQIVLGLDIAELKTGYMILKSDDNEITIIDKGLILTDKLKVITDRLDKISDELNIILEKNNITVGVCEEPFVSFNRNTAIVLALSAGVAYKTLKLKIPYCFFLRAVSARSRIGIKPSNCKKVEAHRQIKELYNFVGQEDETDAFALAIAGLIVPVEKEKKCCKKAKKKKK